MFPAKQRMLLLTLNSRTFLASDDYSFLVANQDWTHAAELHIGDRVRDQHNEIVAVTDITDFGEQPLVCYREMDVPPYYQAGLLCPGSIVVTAEGDKRIEELRPGDCLLPYDTDAPTWTTGGA